MDITATRTAAWKIGDVIEAPGHGSAVIWELGAAGAPAAILLAGGFSPGVITIAPRTPIPVTDPARAERARVFARAEWTRRREGTRRALDAARAHDNDAEDELADEDAAIEAAERQAWGRPYIP
jgi:hypothetical protein